MTKLLKAINGKTIEISLYDTLVVAVVSEKSKEKGYSYAYYSLGGIDTNQPLWGGFVTVISVGENGGECLRIAIEEALKYKGVRVI